MADLSQPSKDVNLFTHLLTEYLKTPDPPAEAAAQLQLFVAFCSQWLEQHPPSALAYLSDGLALRMGDGDQLILYGGGGSASPPGANAVQVMTPSGKAGMRAMPLDTDARSIFD